MVVKIFGHSSSGNFLKVSCGADKKQELFQADMTGTKNSYFPDKVINVLP